MYEYVPNSARAMEQRHFLFCRLRVSIDKVIVKPGHRGSRPRTSVHFLNEPIVATNAAEDQERTNK